MKKRRISNEEQSIRRLSQVIEDTGINVRREKLSRGLAYRVRSAGCLFSGDKTVFVDKNLPEDQQVSILLNYLVDLEINLNEEDLSLLSPANQDFVKSRIAA